MENVLTGSYCQVLDKGLKQNTAKVSRSASLLGRATSLTIYLKNL